MSLTSRSFFGCDVARVEVGPDRTPFTVHIDLLCARSPFFQKALKGPFEESETRIVPMPDDDVESFTEFLNWLYRDKIFENTVAALIPISVPLKLWALADKLFVPSLQKQAMDMVTLKLKNGVTEFTPALSKYLYSNTMPEKVIRQIFVDRVARDMSIDQFKQNKTEWEPEFVQDVCCALLKKSRWPSARPTSFSNPGFFPFHSKVFGTAQVPHSPLEYCPTTVSSLFMPLVERDPSSATAINLYQASRRILQSKPGSHSRNFDLLTTLAILDFLVGLDRHDSVCHD